ncbi:mevalonate kinase family protein [Marinobacterium jannaschii]|uniref:mevalonate kinase family protein n=1 Tax=Marinobacterium jannaschii TaxID=64970 RepID=UPI00055E7908|nr:hypothetical protein [Marinobacterium jannaschii]
MKAIAPGKVILSGEHSVVYGAPAIALAVANHISADFIADREARIDIRFAGAESAALSLSDMAQLPAQLDQRFESFLQGELDITRVLQSPFQLLHYVLGLQSVAVGGCLTTQSTLPMGAGMGSSAAAIAATLLIAERLTGTELSARQRFERVRFCERLQHGRGSAIDAAAVTLGGFVRVREGNVEQLDIGLQGEWYRVDTGSPRVSTGECVQAVREGFAGSAIWNEFADVSDAMIAAMDTSDQLLALIRANHRLLQAIGVVPLPVADFIAEIEVAGGAAKVSGAGAHQGDQGGLVLACLSRNELAKICARHGYRWTPVEEDASGARIISD